MPYITSQFLTRRRDDRPKVVPEGSVSLASIGQFAEVPDDVVCTVECSLRTAWTAVSQLLGLDRRPPEVYKGHQDPHVMAAALETMYRRQSGSRPRRRDRKTFDVTPGHGRRIDDQ